jgi:hypothetical protein
MLYVRVEICRYVDDSQPGWVECKLTDAEGAEHQFVEKVPVVTDADLGPASTYPRSGLLACVIAERQAQNDGGELLIIDTQTPWAAESIAGLSQFAVLPVQIVQARF